ncbi:MAG: hypothetical protein KAU95_02885, partial [Candidatus Aenigmarchaeota archaeon]|nr:hypothetical protein [Candidatus Aenigmarchaeota archaeon]
IGRHIVGFFDWLDEKSEKVIEWITTTDIHAECGFKWYWNETTNVLGVTPVSIYNKHCELRTRIPKKIVEEGNLTSKICYPKEAHNHLWTLPGGLDKFEFYMKVEKVRENWDAKGAVKFCEERCKTNRLWYHVTKWCEEDCREKDIRTMDCASEAHSGECRFAKFQIYLYDNIPEDAIDIKYIVVERDKIKEGGIEEVPEEDYVSVDSACDYWPTVSECGTSENCFDLLHCINIDGKGGKCSPCIGMEGFVCSPNYLNDPPSVDEGLYQCQNVKNRLWPLREDMEECLPVILVTKIYKGEEIESIDCSVEKDAEVTWKINARGLCCADLVTEEGENGKELQVCKEPTNHCPKMKLWLNINSSNVRVINDERYIFEIKQRVCREGYPYNNAPSAFIVVRYPTDKKDLEYVLEDSEVKLAEDIQSDNEVKQIGDA